MYEQVLQRLRGLKPTKRPDTWKALCPAHADHHPSLTVWIGNKGLLLARCWANRGCSFNDIVQAIGLPLKDWFPDDRPKRTMGKIVDTYGYFDEQGRLLYQVLRYDPKDFRQRQPDAKDYWKWSMDGVRRVLYRLPQLLTADPRRMVFVVEGEKDVKTLERLGFLATTNVGGAGKWLSEYSDVLKGRNVCLLPDNDDPGRAHMAMVAGSLMTHGVASVRTVELPGLPDKGDITDWMSGTGTGTREGLIELVRNAKSWRNG